jgi:geranylgeranyl pyrophosphate synthase
VLDLIGDADRLGKPTGIDIASGVYTLPVLAALDGPRGDELRRLLPGASPESRDGGDGADAPGAPGATAANGQRDGADGGDGGDPAGPPSSRPDVARAVELVRDSGGVSVALEAMDRYADDARRAIAHLDQTAIGDGLTAFPRTYMTWALESFMDRRFLEVPLTALG